MESMDGNVVERVPLATGLFIIFMAAMATTGLIGLAAGYISF